MNDVQQKLTSIMLGGCTCDTKTPAVEYHNERCHYRLAREASDLLAERQAALLKAFRELRDEARGSWSGGRAVHGWAIDQADRTLAEFHSEGSDGVTTPSREPNSPKPPLLGEHKEGGNG